MQKDNPMVMNFVDLDMQKSNILRDRAQKVDEKNGVTCLNIMFTPSFMVIDI